GGMGIVGACDIAVASETASFAFTEAKLGLTPAIISLTTLDLMQPRAAARYYLTGGTFTALVAAEIGLITEAISSSSIDDHVARLTEEIGETSPQGAAETKRLLTGPRRRRIAADGDDLAALSARLFASEEGQEGIHAFLERRPPAWRQS
ncbi:MAG: enoyl-CoA hydratase-related protein, partial [Streptosporangiaceae bacterium]